MESIRFLSQSINDKLMNDNAELTIVNKRVMEENESLQLLLEFETLNGQPQDTSTSVCLPSRPNGAIVCLSNEIILTSVKDQRISGMSQSLYQHFISRTRERGRCTDVVCPKSHYEDNER